MHHFELKRLGDTDFDLIVKLRVDFVKDLRPGLSDADLCELSAQTVIWIRDHLEKKDLIGYCGFYDDTPASCASLLLYNLPPLPGYPPRQVGHVLNFFTYKEYRRKGFGFSMMEFIKKDAASLGIFRLSLNATSMGEPLYRKTGFYEQEETALILPLEM